MPVFPESNPLQILKRFCDADPTLDVSWQDIREELDLARNTLWRQRQKAALEGSVADKVAQVFGVSGDWVRNPSGAPVRPDNTPWHPRLIAWVSGRHRMSLEELSFGPAFAIVSRAMQEEHNARVPGTATFGILRLARELDPEGLTAAYLKPRE